MPSRRDASKTGKKLKKRLSSYAAIAAAGTASMTDAQASVIVHQIGVTSPEIAPGEFALEVDINGGMAGDLDDNLVDLYLRSIVGEFADARTPDGGGVASEFRVLKEEAKAFALQLSPSTDVSAALVFDTNPYLFADFPFYGHTGNWDRPDRGFLGIQFLIGADTHFGWVDLSINEDWSLTVNSVAYNDVPGAPIHVESPIAAVPEPASGMIWLTMLAAGATGVHTFRKRVAEQQAA